MTEENSVRYLDKEDIASIHASLSEWTQHQGEPIPDFSFARHADIDALVQTPRLASYGQDLYPTLAEKAAILFYTVNKKQIFLNGNKRMSTLCLLVFLGLNGKWLSLAEDKLTDKALWLATTESLEFPAVKEHLVVWLKEHLIDDDRNAAD